MRIGGLWAKILAVVFGLSLVRLAFVFLNGPRPSQRPDLLMISHTFATLEAAGDLSRCDAHPEGFDVAVPGIGRIRALNADGRPYRRATGDPERLGIEPGLREVVRDGSVLVYGSERLGRCRAFLVQRIDPPAFPRMSLGQLLARIGLVETAATIVISLAVAVPLVRRVRRLAHDTRAVLDADLRGSVAEGADELGELGRAFNEASRAARTRLEDERRRDEVVRTALADLAHDVRTPLASIKLGIDRIAVEPRDELAIATLRAEVDHLDRMFADVATLIQLEGTAIPMKLRPADAREVVERVAVRFRLLARGRRVAIHQHVAAEPLVASIDPVAFEQAVGNLVDNALKFARCDLAILAFERGGDLVVEVHDDGPGVDPRETARLLERGVRGAAERGDGGLGLGLAIARAIVERHGGRLALRPRAEGGALAEIVLALLGEVPSTSDGPGERVVAAGPGLNRPALRAR
jgi:signal transduction histidine kinase